jgi:hypothetical protein
LQDPVFSTGFLKTISDVPIPAAPYFLASALRAPGHGLAVMSSRSLQSSQETDQGFRLYRPRRTMRTTCFRLLLTSHQSAHSRSRT